MVSPRQTFEDNIRPAELLLRLYHILDSDDRVLLEGDLVHRLRQLVGATTQEDLMVIQNELFLGLVRERAQLPRSTLRRATLVHLLRQAVVASCTALETFLPSLLQANLPIVIRAMGRGFIPVGDGEVMKYLKELNFSLDETLRLMADPNAAEYISNKLLDLIKYKYISSDKGVHLVGRLLNLPKPWDQILERLGREVAADAPDPKEKQRAKQELQDLLRKTVDRRNDIVHRADRNVGDPGGPPQDISYVYTLQAVNTIQHVCVALDELTAERMKELQALAAAEADGG